MNSNSLIIPLFEPTAKYIFKPSLIIVIHLGYDTAGPVTSYPADKSEENLTYLKTATLLPPPVALIEIEKVFAMPLTGVLSVYQLSTLKLKTFPET